MVLCPLLLLVVIFPTDWVSGVILLLTTPVIPFYMVLIGKGAESVSRKQMAITRRLSATLLDYLQGMQTIKALGATARAEQTIAGASQELSERTLAVQRIAFLPCSAYHRLTASSATTTGNNTILRIPAIRPTLCRDRGRRRGAAGALRLSSSTTCLF